MRILHLCLACFYIDGYGYQENILPRLSKKKGHEVKIIASTETYVDNAHLGYVEPKSYMTEFGAPIVRLPYKNVLTPAISRKIRKYAGLYREIDAFSPDIIFSHDISYGSLPEVIRYLKEHPRVVFLTDTHSAEYNSGMNWISLHILHRTIYRHYILKALPYIKKVYYVGPAERDFSVRNYGIPESMMEFFPLGGIIPDQEEVLQNRAAVRNENGIREDELVLVHSGKLSPEKQTVMLLRAFSLVPELKARLLIAGSIPDETKDEITDLIEKDERISYLGWCDAKTLNRLLCACDLYCQPGSPSATMQNAVCHGSAIMARGYVAYRDLDTGNFVWVENEADIQSVFKKLRDQELDIQELRHNSEKCASKWLDYNRMEEKIRAWVQEDH